MKKTNQEWFEDLLKQIAITIKLWHKKAQEGEVYFEIAHGKIKKILEEDLEAKEKEHKEEIKKIVEGMPTYWVGAGKASGIDVLAKIIAYQSKIRKEYNL